MEKDHKNEATKMISSTTSSDGGTGSDSSTIDQKEVSGGDNVAMNPGSAKMEEDHQKEGGDDAAVSDSSTLPLPFDSSINITPKKRKLEWILLAIGTSETETTSAETSSSKKICESPPGKLHTITLKAGEDVVDAIFELSKEYNHLRFVSIIAVIGSVSEVVLLDPNAPPNTLKGAFEINSLSVSCLADEDGRHCREKATCSVVLIDDKGKTIENISVGCLIAAGPLGITAATFKKPARETSAAPVIGFYWLNNDSTLSLPLVSSVNITSNKRKEGPETETTTSAETSSKKRRGHPPGSGSKKKREEGPSQTTTSAAETSSQKKRGRPPGSSGGRFTPHVLILNAGEDLVDAIYNLSEAFPRRSVVINSATGSVSEFGILHPNGPPNMRQGIFQILKFVVKCLVDDDGHHCRAKARCGVILTDGNGNTFGSTAVNSLKAAGPVQIIASTFMTDVAKESGARILANAAVARNDNSDSENINEVGQLSCLSPTAKLLPPTPPAAGGNINPTTTTTTSAANDQDMKSPSNTCN